MKRANPEDSIMFVRRSTNPITVKNTNAVKATPRRVDERGEAAAVGYAFTRKKSIRQ
jgi:hypothetical protein